MTTELCPCFYLLLANGPQDSCRQQEDEDEEEGDEELRRTRVDFFFFLVNNFMGELFSPMKEFSLLYNC